MADPGLRTDLEMVCMVTSPVSDEYSSTASGLKGPADSMSHYACHARGAFLKTLVDIFMTASDLDALSKCDLLTNPAAKEYKDITIGSDRLLLEDSRMSAIWKLQYNLVRSHAIVSARHEFGFPYLLAGLGHEDEKEALLSLRWLQRLSTAFEAARGRPEPRIRAIVQSSPMQCVVPRLAVLFGRAADWTAVIGQMKALVRAIFYGPSQTKVIEDTIQKLRDHDCRDGASKTMAMFQAWTSPMDAKVLQTYGFAELEPTINCVVPSSWRSDRSKFAAVHGSNSEKDSCELRNILQKQSWTTYNSQTIWSTYGELQLL